MTTDVGIELSGEEEDMYQTSFPRKLTNQPRLAVTCDCCRLTLSSGTAIS